MIELYNTKSHTALKCKIVGYETPKENWCLLKIRLEQDDKDFDNILSGITNAIAEFPIRNRK